MGVQVIDQTIFPSVLGKTKVFYRPQSLISGNRTLWSFPIPWRKYFDLLPALPLNNCMLLPGEKYCQPRRSRG
jgi:hypothetical protein